MGARRPPVAFLMVRIGDGDACRAVGLAEVGSPLQTLVAAARAAIFAFQPQTPDSEP